MSKSKQKGTAAETAVVRYLQEQGLDARRLPLSGSKDMGDILIPGHKTVTVEVKNHKAMSLAEWVDEAVVEKANAGTDLGVVVHKRMRKGSPAEWYCTMPLSELVSMLKNP